jgi:hypothetical protein
VAVQRFTGTLGEARGGGRWVAVPFDGKAVFGQARAPVRGSVNGTPVRTRLAVYGGVTYLGLTREVREAAGIELGDAVDVELELDEAPREVSVPGELAAVLDGEGLRETYDALAFTHRREYAEWVGSAKQPQTRERRAAKAAEMLRAGIRHP